jgi:hypothetical protein
MLWRIHQKGIGGELVAPGGVELLDGPLQAQGTLLNQVEQLQPLALIFLGNADDKTQVGFHHPLLGAAADANQLFLTIAVVFAPIFLHQSHHHLHLIAEFDLLGWG